MRQDFTIVQKKNSKPKDLSSVYRFLNHKGIRINFSDLKHLLNSDFIAKINPIEDYFENIKHFSNGKTDYLKKLCAFIDTDLDDFEEHFRKTLLRTVNCALNPLFVNKHTMTFTSPDQHIGKTSFLRFLVPTKLNDYYTEYMSFDKDGEMAVANNFMIILDELTAFPKNALNTVKSMMSRRDVKVRPAFSPTIINAPRICSFFATSNEVDFLTDTTGNVRWIICEVNSFDFDYSQKIDMDYVWAEIYQQYLAGETGELTKDDIKILESINQKFLNPNPVLDITSQSFMPCDVGEEGSVWNTTTDLQKRLQGKLLQEPSVQAIGRAMRQLGFVRTQQKSDGGYPVYGYWVIPRSKK